MVTLGAIEQELQPYDPPYYWVDEQGETHLNWQRIGARLQTLIRDVEWTQAWQERPEPCAITYQLPFKSQRSNEITKGYEPGVFWVEFGPEAFDNTNQRLDSFESLHLLAYWSVDRWHYPDGARRIEPPPFPGVANTNEHGKTTAIKLVKPEKDEAEKRNEIDTNEVSR